MKDSILELSKRVLSEKCLVFWGGVFLGVATVSSVFEPRILGWVIDQGMLARNRRVLYSLMGLFALISLGRSFGTVLQSYFFEWIGQKIGQAYRLKILTQIFALPVHRFERLPIGALATRATQDIQSFIEMFGGAFVHFIFSFFWVMGVFVGLFVLESHLAVISLLPFPFFFALVIYFTRRMSVHFRTSRSRLANLNSIFSEGMLTLRLHRAYGVEAKQSQRYFETNALYTQSMLDTVKTIAYLQPSLTIASGLSTSLALYFGLLKVAEGALPLGVFVAFVAYLNAVMTPIRDLVDRWAALLSGVTAFNRMNESVDAGVSNTDSGDSPRGIEQLENIHSIEFVDVWFRYSHRSDWALQSVSFKVEAPMKLALVGQSGSGKTTIVSLILGFYQPVRGRVLVNGVDLVNWDLKLLRQKLGYVPQEPFLFEGTWLENLVFWQRAEELERGAEPLGSEHEAMGLLRDLSTAGKIQEKGNNLSMGERQWVCFARAMARNPSVFLFDEMSSSLDKQTEAHLWRRLFEVLSKQPRMVLLITHRLGALKQFDAILVLRQGRCQEQGSHQELIEMDGEYARLWAQQLEHTLESERREEVSTLTT